MKKISIVLIAILALTSCFAFVGCTQGDDLLKIGVQAGTTAQYYVSGDEDFGYIGYTGAKCVEYDNAGLAVLDMLNGKVDYVMVDEAPAKYLCEHVNGIKNVGIKLTDEEYAFGVDKNNPELLTAINNAIAKFTADGSFDEIIQKYFNGSAVSGITSAVKDDSKNQLVVATNAEFAPFEYKNGNEFCGIDIEIAKLIADELGMELVIVDMDFESVVTSVGTNGIDVAMAGLTVTEKRKQSVNFSSTYYYAGQVIVCKEGDTSFDSCVTAEDVNAVINGK